MHYIRMLYPGRFILVESVLLSESTSDANVSHRKEEKLQRGIVKRPSRVRAK